MASSSDSPTGTQPLRYVALGDSYTIGTAVDADERWPSQLIARLGRGGGLRLVRNLGVNGATSAAVLERQLPAAIALQPEFASLLVGVNDVVRRVPEAVVRANVTSIVDGLGLPPSRILLVSTPDYTVTPEGASYGDPATRRAGIVAVNAAVEEIATTRGIPFVDIFDLSGRAATDLRLVADDGLHPSGAQYALWVDRIAPVVAALLGR
ncbi:MAG TPA: SGNH/GDSL hydrolase family protein [Candidatus Limnocylindrales bacterium]